MFKSFFPKPGPFFISAFIWSLLAVIFWQAGGGDWLLRVTGASQDVAISAARFGRSTTWCSTRSTYSAWAFSPSFGLFTAPTAGSTGRSSAPR